MKVTIRFTPNEIAFIDRIAATLNSSRSYATRALIGSWAVVSQTPLGVMLSPDIREALEKHPEETLKSKRPLIEQLRPMDTFMDEPFNGHEAQTAAKEKGAGSDGRRK